MRDGAILAEGTPADVVTTDVIERVFGMRSRIIPDPLSGTPMVVPESRHRMENPA
jgi:iron complex transport system ATP-binding protein